MRRGSILQLVLLGAVIGAAATVVALFVPWLPENASKERDGIDLVFWFVTAVSIAIFALVAALSVYAVVRFRARPDDDSDGAPIHGHTGLEIVWTAIPAVLVTAITVMSAIVLVRNDRADEGYLDVDVTARQFAFTFAYPDAGGLTSGDLRLPLGRSTKLRLTANDVIHGFWVPQFGQKMDAVPGQETKLVITPTKLGTFPVICTELCGLGHALMRTRAIVMRPAAFDAWLDAQKQAREGGADEAGKAVFASQGCGSCHALKAAGATAEVGPDLDKLPAFAEQAGKPLEQFVKEAIVDPNAYVEAGYPRDVMPATYASLPATELDALVAYLVESSGGGR